MRIYELSFFILKNFFCLIILLVTTTTQAQLLENYKIGADDVLSIVVFDEPDLSISRARVSTSGTIAMPLIGQVEVRGLSISEIESRIAELYLGDYLKNPDISITIVEYRQFYVNGEVEKPGGYSFREGMNVQRAITLAGGFTARASRSNISIISEDSNGKPTKAELATSVKPGDVITVDESFF